jgi:hypothetical protein
VGTGVSVRRVDKLRGRLAIANHLNIRIDFCHLDRLAKSDTHPPYYLRSAAPGAWPGQPDQAGKVK